MHTHSDIDARDIAAIDALSAAMKYRLQRIRDTQSNAVIGDLTAQLRHAVGEGDPVAVALQCAFLLDAGGRIGPGNPMLAASNDGFEQTAFEVWAAKENYNLSQHPLHWLFLDSETYAARQGWKAGIEYASAQATAGGLLVKTGPEWSSSDDQCF